jgi:hypothetical protein
MSRTNTSRCGSRITSPHESTSPSATRAAISQPPRPVVESIASAANTLLDSAAPPMSVPARARRSARSPTLRPLSRARGASAGARALPAEARAKVCPCHSEAREYRGPKRAECLFDGDTADVGDGHADHWKISVVQSPPWRRTSCARAGPPGRSWKSRKKSRSTSMPPCGAQLTRSSHERRSG